MTLKKINGVFAKTLQAGFGDDNFMDINMLIPKQIILEVTSFCNLTCKFCPINDGSSPKLHMDYDFYKSVIDRINFNTTVVPWCNGEPLLHPKYYQMIKMLTDRKTRCYLTTNGTIWNEELFELITDRTSMYQIIFSLDGLPDWKSQSIELARPGSQRSVILGNIDRFLRMKLHKKSKINVGMKICRRGQDWEEIENYIKHWLNIKGVDYVCVGDALVDEHNDKGFRLYPCQYAQNNFMVIKSDGRVNYCAYNTEMQKIENAIGKLDMTTPLLDFYNNEKYVKFREDQLNGKFNSICETCGFAYTGQGFRGTVKFRNGDGKLIHYSRDYYNSFFSYHKNRKPDKYYLRGDMK